MRYLKVLVISILSILMTGCYDINFMGTKTLKSPVYTELLIEGQWKIDELEEINVDEDEKIDKNKVNLSFSREMAVFLGVDYSLPQYKLKIVDNNYIISYENRISLSDYTNENDIKVFTITQNNNTICEFILLSDDSGIIYQNGYIMKVSRISKTAQSIGMVNDDSNMDYDGYVSTTGDTGVMIGLKSTTEEVGYNRESYRTLWISYSDGNLNSIVEEENLILPRLNGIWRITPESITENNIYNEYFSVSQIDGEISKKQISISNESTYRTIDFVGNDYISTRKYIGNNFNGIYNQYELIPIDNINSSIGVSLQDIYGNEIADRYKNEYMQALNKNGKLDKKNYSSVIDYTNFRISRNEGKWEIIGGIKSINSEEQLDFTTSIKLSNKIVTYDKLAIPWKNLKSNILYIRDAYISPNEKIAIIIHSDFLSVYEIIDDKLSEKPLKTIELNKNENVIMAEWCTEGYVERWSKPFKNGIVITD